MALNCDPTPPFFPPVYNEDMVLWLEMLRHDPASACVVGTLTQREYDPFDDPQRGADQEFGELLVEGMTGAARLDESVRPEFWRLVLRDRRAMLHQLTARLTELRVPNGERVVQMALDAHSDDWPALLAAFVADWERDLTLWSAALTALPRANRLDQVPALLQR